MRVNCIDFLTLDQTRPDPPKTENFVTRPDLWVDPTRVQLCGACSRRTLNLRAISEFFSIKSAISIYVYVDGRSVIFICSWPKEYFGVNFTSEFELLFGRAIRRYTEAIRHLSHFSHFVYGSNAVASN